VERSGLESPLSPEANAGTPAPLPRAVLVPNKLQVQYRLSRELLETVKSMEIPATPGLRLRQTYADAAGQGAVVWSLGRRGRAAANEIRGLFDGLFR